MTLSEPVWTHAKPYLEAALSHAPRTHDIEDVRAMIEAGEAQLWSAAHSAVVTRIYDEPKAKTLFYWLIGGEMDEVLGPLMTASETWARSIGCTFAMGAGRKGFERALAPHDYRFAGTMMVKELK